MLQAKQLKRSEAQKKFIRQCINSLLNKIDDDLKIAHEQGLNEAVVSLPTTFEIPYLRSNAEAQRIIYSSIIASLVDRDFIPEIDMRQDVTLITVTWMSTEDKDEILNQHDIIAKYSKRKVHKIDDD
jgi:hypothetical protein